MRQLFIEQIALGFYYRYVDSSQWSATTCCTSNKVHIPDLDRRVVLKLLMCYVATSHLAQNLESKKSWSKGFREIWERQLTRSHDLSSLLRKALTSYTGSVSLRGLLDVCRGITRSWFSFSVLTSTGAIWNKVWQLTQLSTSVSYPATEQIPCQDYKAMDSCGPASPARACIPIRKPQSRRRWGHIFNL